ncbi:MAG: HlyD family efflux transporter periplasmic adaptor subunit [Rhodopirellula sp.]|mgnify:CR=1 FL=1|nr:HlyD family efflux transporter periplasmic adaptor subunit [Rhodopirellula sp.]
MRKIRTFATLALGLGLALGAAATWFFTEKNTAGSAGSQATPVAGAEKPQVWTCSMHPQIRMDHFDLCPLCGMDLTPVEEDTGGDQPATQLKLSEQARMMARVATAELKRHKLFKDLRTVGRVELDETRVSKIAAWIDGRADEVYADFPGTPVRKGEHLVSIYSPELVSAQEEFLTAHRREQELRQSGRQVLTVSLSAAARKRLQLWGITDAQLDELARTGKSQTQMTVYAPIGGTIIEKYVREGEYVKQGDPLYDIADLSHVWLVLEVYESELSWVKPGQPVEVILESQPNGRLAGVVGFIEPLLNKTTRTVQVRVVLENPAGQLKPGMYAEALLRTAILPDGTPASSGLEGKYVCPMHPYVVSDQPGDCGVCNMPLERVPGERSGAEEHPHVLALPAEAVLTTGRRQLVYVEVEPGIYRLVEPKLGPRAGDWFPVVSGLKEGDRVVVRGNFLIDSQFQVTGKPSLLYPHGSMGGTGHEGHGAPPAKPKEPDAKMLANLDKLPPEDREAAKAQKTCPVTDALLGSMGKPYKMMVGNRAVFLCCKGCEGKVKKEPDAVLKKLGGEHAGHGE